MNEQRRIEILRRIAASGPAPMTDARELRGRLDELKYVAGELRPALDALLNEPEPERVRAAIVARVCGMLEDAATAERQRCAAALERMEALEATLRTAFPTALMRATIYGSFSMANAVLEERDYEGNWHEVAWSEDDKPPMEALRELLETYQPIGATPAPAGAPITTDQT